MRADPKPLRAKFIVRLVYFAFLISLIACSPARLQRYAPPPNPDAQTDKAIVQTAPAVEASEVVLPEILGRDSLLSLWKDELLNPHLSARRNIQIQCSSDDTSIILKFAEDDAVCPVIVNRNTQTNNQSSNNSVLSKLSLSCASPTSLIIHISKNRCSTSPYKKSLLATLIAPQHWALFVQDSAYATMISPNREQYPLIAPSLVPLKFSKTSTSFVNSNWSAWLQNASPSGSFAIDLEVSSATKTGLSESDLRNEIDELMNTLQKAKHPKLLAQPALEKLIPPSAPPPSAKNLPSKEAPGVDVFFAITKTPEDTTLKEACHYLDSWLKATQLAQFKDLSQFRVRRIGLDCTAKWADESIPDFGFRIAKLPLPLQFSDSGLFPIKTLDEARSVAVLQSLKVLK